MSIFRLAWCLAAIAAGAAVEAAEDIERLRQPQNSAFSLPLGQGLDLTHSAEPLGKSRFRLRAVNRSIDVVLPGLGSASSFTGLYGIGYGLSDGTDISLMVPFYLDTVSGLNKYGSGDPALTIKWARPSTVPASFYKGFQILVGLPLGFMGEVALDNDGGVRPFSNEAVDVGFQGLMDMHLRWVSIYLNGGLFRSGNPDVDTQLVYSAGFEFLRRNRWVSIVCDTSTPITRSNRAAIGSSRRPTPQPISIARPVPGRSLSTCSNSQVAVLRPDSKNRCSLAASSASNVRPAM